MKKPLHYCKAFIHKIIKKTNRQIDWFSPDFSDEQFENFLYKEIRKKITGGCNYIILTELNPVAELLAKRLRRNGFQIGFVSTEKRSLLEKLGIHHFCSIKELSRNDVFVQAIVVTNTNSKVVHDTFRKIKEVPALEKTPLIFKIRDNETYPLINELDKYPDHVFITTQFDDDEFEDIYRYSLTKVPQKCQVRDAYDLFQCIRQVERLEGDIIEFGSYQGHSGILMAEFLKRKQIEKKLYLCDMFVEFPNEILGVDKIWTGTHKVDFSRIKEIFKPYSFVSLVKGDFEDTVYEIPSEKIAFVMIDCDSYRATRFVSDYIFPKLVQGGIMFFEDYGHGPCLGARMAIDEFLELNKDKTFSIFSFFSGVLIVVKLA